MSATRFATPTTSGGGRQGRSISRWMLTTIGLAATAGTVAAILAVSTGDDSVDTDRTAITETQVGFSTYVPGPGGHRLNTGQPDGLSSVSGTSGSSGASASGGSVAESSGSGGVGYEVGRPDGSWAPPADEGNLDCHTEPFC